LLDLLKILAVFALIVWLLKLKWNLGAVMLIGAAALGLLMGLAPPAIFKIALHASVDASAVSLIVALALIMVLENVLRKTETLKRMVDSMKGLVGDQRLVMALMPAIIGILPSAGGAYFSAPMVEASADGSHIRPERKSFINYWFRHIWEYISPLYPGFIIMAKVAGVGMGRIFLYQIAFPLTVLATGAMYAFKDVRPAGRVSARRSKREDLAVMMVSISPILVVMLLVMALKVDIAVAMVIVVAGLFVYFRYGPSRIWATLKESISYKTLLLVLGVEIFRAVMKGSGAVDHLPQFFQSEGVPVVLILFILPFLVGMITGITLAFVGVTFPMLLPLIGGSNPDMAMLAFAFASGFAGVMFSPVHLCLVLTKDYFKSELWPIYKIMLIPEGLVIAVAALQMAVF
jgi:integral membrane protein (TIGR00529 family)